MAQVEKDTSESNGYAVLDAARLPFVITTGPDKIISYVNLAFSTLFGKNGNEIIGTHIAKLISGDDICLRLLDEVYQTGRCETYWGELSAEPHDLYWSYEIWPIYGEKGRGTDPESVVLQVTETRSFHRRTTLFNEALLSTAVRYHELVENAETVNGKLRDEIQEQQRVEREIEQLAFYDPLTDLPNRRLLLDRLHHATLACYRTMRYGAILFIDLDRFKNVNDSLGHHRGDLLLQQLTQRLKQSVREGDTVARLGGDEFVIMLEDLSDVEAEATLQAEKIGLKVLTAFDPPYSLEGHQQHCTGSIGITLFGKTRESVDELLRRADLAQYRAKAAGGRAIRFFDLAIHTAHTASMERSTYEVDLNFAVQNGQLLLHYQPQVDRKGHLRGVEALLRWNHPQRGLLLPSEFITYAEEHGVIESIGLWTLATACRQLAAWSLSPETSYLTIAVNISAKEFAHPAFVTRVLKIIDENRADASKLIFEFTERMMFGPLEHTLGRMIALTTHGIRFALDDFGMGFSSLTWLKELPISEVKLDRSFVWDVLTNRSSAAIASAVINLGTTLGLSVVAEGVETREQVTFLAMRGCQSFQGFFFGEPRSVEYLALNGQGREGLSHPSIQAHAD
jgi:diguanylate cyclase (GGDEF)-like protein